MYELFTLGGGTYLVDLLNAVAAITGGGAYITLAQLAGVAGLAWVLFRTAFGGSWKDNAKWMLLFVTVWGAMIVPKATVRVVDRLDPTLAPGRGGERAHRPGAVRFDHVAGRRRADAAHRAGVHAAGRPPVPAPRADLRGQARRQGDAPGNHRRGVRAERPRLRPPVRVPRAACSATSRRTTCANRPTSGRWSRPSGSPSAGASPARMVEYATRQAATGTGATPIDRAIVTCQVDAGVSAQRASGTRRSQRAGTVFGRRIFPDAQHRTRWPAPSFWPRSPPRIRLPDRRVALGGARSCASKWS